MKKWLILIAVLMGMLMCATATAEVDIDAAHFPDPAFQRVAAGFDTNADGTLQDSEIAAVDYLSCEGKGITSLKGIEYFSEVTFLVCSDNQLTELDLSGNQKLRVAYCEKNRLSVLNVSGNARLECLDCQYNQLRQLNVTHNPKLEGLTCHHNQLTRLDISHCKILVQLFTSTDGYTNYGSYSEWAGGDYNLTVDNSVKIITKSGEDSDDQCTVGGLKYRLSGAKAIVTGAKSKSATTLTIPATIRVKGKTYKVTGIGASAFKGMTKLTRVVIGKNIGTIGKSAFQGCSKLKSVTIKTTKLTSSSVKSNAFRGIYSKATFRCPKGKVNAYRKILLKKGAAKTCIFR